MNTLAGFGALILTLASAAAWAQTEREFTIATVHLDGNANVNGDAAHPPEAFPTVALPGGGGLIASRPNERGDWRIRAFVFHPAQVIVQAGDRVALHFVGVQGPAHKIRVDGRDEVVEIKRGEMKTVRFVAERPGVIEFVSIDRGPSMRGSVVVLPR